MNGFWGWKLNSTKQSIVRLLAVDDDPQQLNLIQKCLAGSPVEIFATSNPQEGLDFVQLNHPHIALLDLMMPQINGMDMMARILEMDPGVEVILITGQYTIDSAVEAVRKGASDYLTKPVSVGRLRDKIIEIHSYVQLRERSLHLEDELRKVYQFEGIIGSSPVMFDLFSTIRRVAPHYRTALLLGETGTGKELTAKALHRLSPVSSGPFVAFNCSAIVETLSESELFGHAKGAFTGATYDKIGIFEQANGGTLMLDEIGELSLPIQAKLLRVLQDQQIQRVGSPKSYKVDVRIIAATHRDLRAMVAEKTFREDLYYRLSMIEIGIPPLNQRKEDLSLLQRHFLKVFAEQYDKPIRGLTRRVQALFSRYSWPGNVRELENVLGFACLMAHGDIIDIQDLPQQMVKQMDLPTLKTTQNEACTLEQNQHRYVREIVERIGNKMQAANLLGISRTTLYRILNDQPHSQSKAKLSPV